MTIKITASMLCDLCGGRFTLDACEAICEICEESEMNELSIGDICLSFEEISAEDYAEEYGEEDDYIMTRLDNGNVLVTM